MHYRHCCRRRRPPALEPPSFSAARSALARPDSHAQASAPCSRNQLALVMRPSTASARKVGVRMFGCTAAQDCSMSSAASSTNSGASWSSGRPNEYVTSPPVATGRQGWAFQVRGDGSSTSKHHGHCQHKQPCTVMSAQHDMHCQQHASTHHQAWQQCRQSAP
jgi:hypothetical protein